MASPNTHKPRKKQAKKPRRKSRKGPRKRPVKVTFSRKASAFAREIKALQSRQIARRQASIVTPGKVDVAKIGKKNRGLMGWILNALGSIAAYFVDERYDVAQPPKEIKAIQKVTNTEGYPYIIPTQRPPIIPTRTSQEAIKRFKGFPLADLSLPQRSVLCGQVAYYAALQAHINEYLKKKDALTYDRVSRDSVVKGQKDKRKVPSKFQGKDPQDAVLDIIYPGNRDISLARFPFRKSYRDPTRWIKGPGWQANFAWVGRTFGQGDEWKNWRVWSYGKAQGRKHHIGAHPKWRRYAVTSVRILGQKVAIKSGGKGRYDGLGFEPIGVHPKRSAKLADYKLFRRKEYPQHKDPWQQDYRDLEVGVRFPIYEELLKKPGPYKAIRSEATKAINQYINAHREGYQEGADDIIQGTKAQLTKLSKS